MSLLCVGLEAKQALMPCGQFVTQPDAANAGGTDVDVLQPQLVGDPLRAIGRALQTQRQDLLLDLRRHAVRMR